MRIINNSVIFFRVPGVTKERWLAECKAAEMSQKEYFVHIWNVSKKLENVQIIVRGGRVA